MKILYLGNLKSSATSRHRANALERLGHEVVCLNPYENLVFKVLPGILVQFHFKTGYRFIQGRVSKWLEKQITQLAGFDVVWINAGELLGIQSMKLLKRYNCPLVLYNNDDPTGGRDGRRFDSLLQALPNYDLCAVLRESNVSEYRSYGVKNVIRVYMSYDELEHTPFKSINDIPEHFRSDVAFIGTWMRHEKRDEFLLELINQGIPVTIWGGRWEKSPLWNELREYYRGPALSGRDYVAAIQGAKICLGMLSKGNRDLHTRRSVEIPFIGGLFCAERTSEHLAMYREGIEAVYWDDAKECANICKQLLSDDALRDSIRNAGQAKVKMLKVGNEDICDKILNVVRGLPFIKPQPVNR